MRKLALTLMLLCLHGLARGQTGDNKCLYWFDANQSSLQQGYFSGQQWQQTIDVSGLSCALHTVYLMVVDDKGRHSQPVTRTFMKVNSSTGIEGYYWFDKNTEDIKKSPIASGVFDVDVSQLPDGFHTFFYQVTKIDGSISQPVSHMFLKIAQTEEVDYMTCVCSIDGEMYKKQRLSNKGGIIEWEFDVSNLSFGIHRIQVQAVTPSGAATQPQEAFFVRTNTSSELNEMHCVYSVDGKISGTEAGALGNGAYHFDIDMAQLSDGIHRLSYQLTDGKRMSTPLQTHFFIKNPVGGNGITQYEYWINDLAEEPHKTVLNQPVTPYNLAALLPIESQPLRSSQFHFELKDGEPYIYAKNSFHVRFYDKSQRFTDTTEEYVDYAMSQAVTDVDELTSGVRETIEKPAENTIKWYKFEAERGDSLRFRLDRAATIQLFAPSNQEVYNVSGSESVGWGGLHVSESGTFYVAIHDVTATQGTTISLDYDHIDKYAVLSQDVKVVGDVEYSTITFEGNGFDELESVDLIMGEETITSVEIKTEGKAQAAVKFCFDGASHGDYRAEFHFKDGNVVVEKCIKVEEAIPYTFDVSAVYNKKFLRAQHKTQYTFKVHNNGNVTAYGVPLWIRIYSQSAETLNRIDVGGYDMINNYKEFFGDDYTENHDRYFDYMRSKSGDKCFFLETDRFFVIDGLASNMLEAFVFPDLPPNSTTDITVSLDLSDSVYCYIWYPVVKSEKTSIYNPPSSAARRKTDWLRDLWEKIKDNIEGLKNTASKKQRCAWAKVEPGYNEYYDCPTDQSRRMVKRLASEEDCGGDPPPPPGPGGPSKPVESLDPNEIYGYEAESGSKAIMDGLTCVSYTVQFENDATFATAAAHDIWVRDTLDVNKFDLSTYRPTKVKIGNKEMDLDGSPNFIVTMGMQPEINAVAQIEGTFDEKTGIVCWHLLSLDPMTVEPTNDVMQGILPVNYDGQGIGEVSYDIKLKDGLEQGTEIKNRAGIVFDTNEKIMTPYWRNVIDHIAPESYVADVQMATDTTAAVRIAATDELSGPWRYNVYVQYGDGAWFLGAENVPIDKVANVKVYEGIDHGFYTVVTDSAGNVEQKDAAREFTLEVFGSQVETNTQLALAEGWNWISHNQQEALSAETLKPKAQRIVSQTEELYKDSHFGWSGDLDELLPTEMYKVQMTEAEQVQLSGLLFNAAFRSVPLREGWNWIGYPVNKTMTPTEALAKLEAEEGDVLIGQDGMAQYNDGQWTGTLMELNPGHGYMYRSVSDKNLFLNATAQSSSRRAFVQRRKSSDQYSEVWQTDKRKYPNVMGTVIRLCKNGEAVNADEWLVGAFCGDECRGVAEPVSDVLMMNVYGRGNEQIVFRVIHRESGELVGVSGQEAFRTDLLGTMQQPYELNIGQLTGIKEIDNLRIDDPQSIYDLQGRKIENGQSVNGKLNRGVYIVTDSNNSQTQKVVTK